MRADASGAVGSTDLGGDVRLQAESARESRKNTLYTLPVSFVFARQFRAYLT